MEIRGRHNATGGGRRFSFDRHNRNQSTSPQDFDFFFRYVKLFHSALGSRREVLCIADGWHETDRVRQGMGCIGKRVAWNSSASNFRSIPDFLLVDAAVVSLIRHRQDCVVPSGE